jgi:hypothetical protein
MTDGFHDFLKSELAPPDRAPDRSFVTRVQAAIALEERLAAHRSSLVRGLVKQLVALAGIAAGLSWVGKAAPVASWFAGSPAVGLTVLLAAFAFVIVLLGRPEGRRWAVR